MDGVTNISSMGNTERKRHANSLSGKEWLRRSFSIWRNLSQSKQERGLEHPATFPITLAKQVIECYSDLSDTTVLDPFAGSGTTLIASLELGANAIGLDLNPEFETVFNSRFESYLKQNNVDIQYHVRDARDIALVVDPESIDICFTSPPYWDILNNKRTADSKVSIKYSDIPEDLGNQSEYDRYLNDLIKILNLVVDTLKPNGYLVVNVMDLRKGPNFYPLHIDLVNGFSSKDISLDDIIIWDRQSDYNSMRPLGFPYKFIINKVHEYLLVYRKQGA